MSSIVTFYSYKGGVGRSMALANVAYLLAIQGKKVLIVDWDLEAPGLERYFSNFKTEMTGDGLLPLLKTVSSAKMPDYRNYLWNISLSRGSNISLLHSGREKDSSYSKYLEEFDWNEFFEKNGGGEFLENLRSKWHEDYDIVLIDSRTGLSDSSGICTILLPDIVVALFTGNYQSLYGVRDIMRLAQASRQKLDNDRMMLTIVPIPSRFGTRVEFKESQEWLERFSDVLKEFYGDWLPKWIEPKYILEQIKIPQIDYFSFGEKLAVVEQSIDDPEGMGYIYSKISTLIADDFKDIASFVGHDYYHEKKAIYKKSIEENVQIDKTKNSFEYDIFISFQGSRNTKQWIDEFLPILTEYLIDELNREPKVFINYTEVSIGGNWIAPITNALETSKIFIPLLTPEYFQSSDCIFELKKFIEKDRQERESLIFPILLHEVINDDDSLFLQIKNKSITDFTFFYDDFLRRTISTKLKINFFKKIEEFVKLIAPNIRKVSYEKPAKRLQKLKNSNSVMKEIKILAKEYEDLRETMISGYNRTKLMEEVAHKMSLFSYQLTPFLTYLTKSKSPGERLAAIMALQNNINKKYFNWLARRVGNSEQNFIGYQASIALFIAARSMSKDKKHIIGKSIETAIHNLRNSKDYDINQLNVLNSALVEIGYKVQL